MQTLPETQNNDIITQSIGKEVLIYNLITHKAYCLNETSSIVYQACDGKTSFSELKAKSSFTDEIIYLALDELQKNDLITDYESGKHFRGLSRREAIRKVGLASMITLPIVTSLIAPSAIQAASPAAVQPCVANGGFYLPNTTPADTGRCAPLAPTRCCNGLRAALFDYGPNQVFCLCN